MPQKKLEQVLFEHQGPKQPLIPLPHSPDDSPEVRIIDFVKGLLGDQKAGSLTAGLGAMAGFGKIPKFRSKSTMIVDMLDRMKKSPPTVDGSALQDFMLSGGGGQAKGYSRIPTFEDVDVHTNLMSDPVGGVANLKGWDDYLIDPGNKHARENIADMGKRSVGSIDKLTNDLSQYFTSPKFDPFPDSTAVRTSTVVTSPGRKTAADNIRAIRANRKPKGPNALRSPIVRSLDTPPPGGIRYDDPLADAIDATHEGQHEKMIGGLYDVGYDLSINEMHGLMPYLQRIGMDWDQLKALPASLQKDVISSFRATFGRR